MRMSCPNLFFGITMAYHAKAIHRLGWTLLVLGTLSIILGTAAVATMASKNRPTFLTYIAGPIWSGIFVLSTGILGVVSGKNPKNNCLIVAFMVLGIFTILATFCSFGLAVTGAIVDSCYWRWIGYRCGVIYVNASDYDYYNGTATNFTAFDYFDIDDPPEPVADYSDKDDCTTTAKALHGVNALLAFAELVLGFVVSIMCCCGLCSATNTPIMSDGQGGFILLQAVPDSRQFGAQQQVFLAPPGGPHAPLQVYYTAGPAPPQYSQPGGMGAAAAPPQYSQPGGMGAAAAPPQYSQPGGMGPLQHRRSTPSRAGWGPLQHRRSTPSRAGWGPLQHRRSTPSRAGWGPLQHRRSTPSMPLPRRQKHRPWNLKLHSLCRLRHYCVIRYTGEWSSDSMYPLCICVVTTRVFFTVLLCTTIVREVP
ncbi:uncharacterized protein LOC144928192 isoform X2 [Branchiostoma floridae x Branchiostoma belcheri]